MIVKYHIHHDTDFRTLKFLQTAELLDLCDIAYAVDVRPIEIGGFPIDHMGPDVAVAFNEG